MDEERNPGHQEGEISTNNRDSDGPRAESLVSSDYSKLYRMYSEYKNDPAYDVSSSWTIYRVPENLRQVHNSALVPKIISIGPLHWGDRLWTMQHHKSRYFMQLFDRLDNSVRRKALIDLHHSITRLEERAIACYSEAPSVDFENHFVEAMASDGCFVIELLRLFYEFDKQGKHIDDPIFRSPRMLQTIRHDLLMLENQIPFFILEEIFKLTSTDEEQDISLPELAATFFDPLLPREDVLQKLKQGQRYEHLLHLFRTTFLSEKAQRRPSHGSKDPASRDRQLTHCAVQLKEAGIKFQRRESRDLMDIGYSNRVLEIPRLHIDENSVPLFFNFLAFEQCDLHAEPIFTNYLMFLDSLIHSKNDIHILQKEGIISHVLGNDEDAAALINRMGRGIVHVQDSYLSAEIKGANDRCSLYYEGGWRMWWSNLMKTYFSNPWSIISLLAGIVLLLLAALQTFYTVYPYYHPK